MFTNKYNSNTKTTPVSLDVSTENVMSPGRQRTFDHQKAGKLDMVLGKKYDSLSAKISL